MFSKHKCSLNRCGNISLYYVRYHFSNSIMLNYVKPKINSSFIAPKVHKYWFWTKSERVDIFSSPNWNYGEITIHLWLSLYKLPFDKVYGCRKSPWKSIQQSYLYTHMYIMIDNFLPVPYDVLYNLAMQNERIIFSELDIVQEILGNRLIIP